jgi:hypothetical protein
MRGIAVVALLVTACAGASAPMLAPAPATTTVQSEPRAGHDLFDDLDAAATDAQEFVSHRDLDATPDRRIPTWRMAPHLLAERAAPVGVRRE